MTDTKEITAKITWKDIFYMALAAIELIIAVLLVVGFVVAIVVALVQSGYEKDAAQCDTANTAYSAAYVDYESTLRKAQRMLTGSDSQRLDTKTREVLTNLTKSQLEKTPDAVCGYLVTADAVDDRNTETRDVQKATIRLKEALLNAEYATDK